MFSARRSTARIVLVRVFPAIVFRDRSSPRYGSSEAQTLACSKPAIHEGETVVKEAEEEAEEEARL
jgi:hypothetical protein